MDARRKLLLLATAFLLACAFGARADTVYAVHVPATGPDSEPALYSGPVPPGGVSLAKGDWDIRVVLDPVKCELYCSYRRRPDPFGRVPSSSLLPPPAVSVVVFARTVTVDPGRLRFPGLAAASIVSHPSLYLPGRKLFACALSQETVALRVAQVLSLEASHSSPMAVHVVPPLRI